MVGNTGGSGEDPNCAYGIDNWKQAADMVVQKYDKSRGAACARQLLRDTHALTDDHFFDSKIDIRGLSAEQIAKRLGRYDRRYEGGTYDAFFDIANSAQVIEVLSDMFEGNFIAAQGKHGVVVESVNAHSVILLDSWGITGPGSVSGVRARISYGNFVDGLRNGRFSLVGIRKNRE